MIQDWQLTELEEKIGQGVKLIEMVYADPDNPILWAKLRGWASDHKSYISSSYDEPNEAKGYDISLLDGEPGNLNF